MGKCTHCGSEDYFEYGSEYMSPENVTIIKCQCIKCTKPFQLKEDGLVILMD